MSKAEQLDPLADTIAGTLQHVRNKPTPDVGTLRHCAMMTARSLVESCGPVPWPRRPTRLAFCTPRDLDELRKRVRRGDRRGDDAMSDYAHAQQWFTQGGSVASVNTSRLRGLMWCVTTLHHYEDPTARQLYRLARDYLREVWGVEPEAPNTMIERERLTHATITRMHNEAMR